MKARCLLTSYCALILLSSGALAQPAGQALEQFKTNNPGARFYGSQFYQPVSADDEGRSDMTAVYGTVLSMGETPEQSAWSHFDDLRGVLGDEIGTLVPEIKESGDVIQGVLWNAATQSHKFNVIRFNQFLEGVPVFRSGVGFLIRNQLGNPVVMSGSTVKDLTGNKIVVPAAGAKPVVTQEMLANVNNLMNAVPIERSVVESKKAPAKLRVTTSEVQYVVFAGVNGEFAVPQLAVSFVATRGSIKTLPDYHKYLVIASVANGEILYEETEICHCHSCLVNIQGSVSGRATQGLATLECDPESAVPLPYAEISVAGGNTVFADANGNFDVPHGGTGAVNVTSRLRGQYFEVRDQSAGNTIPEITSSITPPGPANFLHNPTTTNNLMTANVNGYVEANVVRDYVLAYEPTFPVIYNQLSFDINTNIASSCNAFYDGTSINFYQNGGGCNNTAFSDVVHHEYGHHLINVTGNGQGQMGEGTGDVVGVLIQDDPILGQGFQGNCSSGIRNANNTKQYPCTGEIHDCGQLISGCVWSTRNELIVTEPTAYLDISSELFLGMLIVRGTLNPGQTTIAPDITVIYLELDDDDTDIGNGTPHYEEIAAGFGAHNMDAPPLSLLAFDYPNGRPQLIPHDGGVAFEVEVLPLLENPQPGTGKLFVDIGDGNGFQQYSMNETSPNVYQAVFPPAPCATAVRYYLSADSSSSSTMFNPNNAPAGSYEALMATSAVTIFYDDAETDTGWTVSGDATDGQWDRGVPVGGGDRGDPATDGDGSGACWLTDNVDGNSDVDGGSTILTSPVLNASPEAWEIPLIKYWRFYSNTAGNSPQADTFVVEISNNGGSTWVNLETVGPTGAEVAGGWYQKTFKISDFVTPTSNVRIRFNASDLGAASVVEAGIDGVEIVMARCQTQVDPQSASLRVGIVTNGTVTDVLDSDDSYYEIVSGPDSDRRQTVLAVFASETDIVSPTRFSFRVESSMEGGPSGDVKQIIELRDWINDGWVQVDLRTATTGDSIADGVANGDLTRFVHPETNQILTRVIWESPSFSGTPFVWSINVDQAVWILD